MEYVIEQEARKVLERELHKARQQRQRQVREQSIQWTEKTRRKYDKEKNRQVKVLAEALTKEAEEHAKARIEHLIMTNDLAMAELGSAHRAAAALRDSQATKELKRLHHQEMAIQRGRAAVTKSKVELEKKSLVKNQQILRREEVRQAEDRKVKEMLLQRKPLSTITNRVVSSPVKKVGSCGSTGAKYQQNLAAKLNYPSKKPNKPRTPVKRMSKSNQSLALTPKSRVVVPVGRFEKEVQKRISGITPTKVKRVLPKRGEERQALPSRYSHGNGSPAKILQPAPVVKNRSVSAVKYYDKAIPTSAIEYIAPPGIVQREVSNNSPDSWNKAKRLSQKAMEETEDKARKQEEVIRTASERGKKASKKAKLQKKLSALTNELMAGEESRGLELDDHTPTTAENRAVSSVTLTEVKIVSPSNLEFSKEETAAETEEKENSSEEFLPLTSDDEDITFDDETTKAQLTHKAKLKSKRAEPSQTAEKPSTSTPDGITKLKTSKSIPKVKPSVKDVVLERVVTAFLLRNKSSIDALPVSSSSSSETRIDSDEATRSHSSSAFSSKIASQSDKATSSSAASHKLKTILETKSPANSSAPRSTADEKSAVFDASVSDFDSYPATLEGNEEEKKPLKRKLKQLMKEGGSVNQDTANTDSHEEISNTGKIEKNIESAEISEVEDISSKNNEPRATVSALTNELMAGKESHGLELDDHTPTAENRAVSSVTLTEVKIVSPSNLEFSKKETAAETKEKENPSEEFLPLTSDDEEVTFDDETPKTQLTHKAKLKSKRAEPSQTAEKPYTSTPDGITKLKASKSIPKAKPSVKDVVLERVVTAFLLRNKSSIDALPVSSSSSSEIRIDSDEATRSPSSSTFSSKIASQSDKATSSSAASHTLKTILETKSPANSSAPRSTADEKSAVFDVSVSDVDSYRATLEGKEEKKKPLKRKLKQLMKEGGSVNQDTANTDSHEEISDTGKSDKNIESAEISEVEDISSRNNEPRATVSALTNELMAGKESHGLELDDHTPTAENRAVSSVTLTEVKIVSPSNLEFSKEETAAEMKEKENPSEEFLPLTSDDEEKPFDDETPKTQLTHKAKLKSKRAEPSQTAEKPYTSTPDGITKLKASKSIPKAKPSVKDVVLERVVTAFLLRNKSSIDALPVSSSSSSETRIDSDEATRSPSSSTFSSKIASQSDKATSSSAASHTWKTILETKSLANSSSSRSTADEKSAVFDASVSDVDSCRATLEGKEEEIKRLKRKLKQLMKEGCSVNQDTANTDSHKEISDTGKSEKNIESAEISEVEDISSRNNEPRATDEKDRATSSATSGSTDREVKRINEFVGDISGYQCREMWCSPPVCPSQEPADIVSSVFEELRDQWSSATIERPPWLVTTNVL